MQNLKISIIMIISITGCLTSCKNVKNTSNQIKKSEIEENLNQLSTTAPPTCTMTFTFMPSTETDGLDTTHSLISAITRCNTVFNPNPNPHRSITCSYTDNIDNPHSVSLIETTATLPDLTGMAGVSLSPNCKNDTVIICDVVTGQGTLSNNVFYCNKIFQTIPTVLIFD